MLPWCKYAELQWNAWIWVNKKHDDIDAQNSLGFLSKEWSMGNLLYNLCIEVIKESM